MCRCSAMLLLTSIIKQDSHIHKGFTCCSLSDKNTFLPSSLYFQCRIPPFSAFHAANKGIHKTQISSVLLECINSQTETKKEESQRKKLKLNEELQADQRCKNARVYLLLAVKVVMMRTEPNIHGQHMETQLQKNKKKTHNERLKRKAKCQKILKVSF